MSTNAGSVANVTAQKFIDACIASVKRRDGTAPDAAPNAFKDREQTTIDPTETSDFQVIFRTGPGGNSATLRIDAIGSRAASILGEVDFAVLATKLV